MSKRKVCTFFICLVLILMSFAALTSCKDNLGGNRFVNGDFLLRDDEGNRIREDGFQNQYKYWSSEEDATLPYGWGFYQHDAWTVRGLQRDVMQSDSLNFFSIEHGDNPTFSYLKQTVSVRKNTYYTISAMYRTANIGSYGSLRIFVEEDPTWDSQKVYNETTLNLNAWREHKVTVHTSELTSLNIYYAFGGTSQDLFGIDPNSGQVVEGNSNMTYNGGKGTLHLRNLVVEETVTPPTNARKLQMNSTNLFANHDLTARDANGLRILEQGGGYKLNANEDGTPVDWSFAPADAAKASYSAGRETASKEMVGEDEREYKSNNNFIRVVHNDFTYSTVYQRVEVEPKSYYQISYYYYIPYNSMSFSVANTQQGNFGVHVGFMQDPLYILNSRTQNFLNTQNHVSATASTTNSRWKYSSALTIYSGENSYLDVGVNFGIQGSMVRGEYWITSMSIKQVDKANTQSTGVYNIQNNNGFDDSLTKEIVALVVLLVVFVALILLAVWAIANALSKNKVKNSGKAKEHAEPVVQEKEQVAEAEQQEGEPDKTNEEQKSEQEQQEAVEGADEQGQEVEAEQEEQPQQEQSVQNEDAFERIEQRYAQDSITDRLLKGLGKVGKCLAPLWLFGSVLVLGLVLRLIFAAVFIGYRETTNALIAQLLVLKEFKSGFYLNNTTDVMMPFYALIMRFYSRFVGEYPHSSTSLNFLLKLPTIIADTLIAVVLYKISKRHSKGFGVCLAALYYLNPLTIFNAAVLRIDTLFVFFLVLSVYFLLKKQRLLVFVSYTFAVLTHHYALIIAPVFVAYFAITWVYALIEEIKKRKRDKLWESESAKTLLFVPIYSIGALLLFYLVSLPFSSGALGGSIIEVFRVYFVDRFTEYKYLTFNTLDIFNMVDFNGAELNEGFPALVVTLCFFVAIALQTIFVYVRQKNRANVVLLMAVAVFAIQMTFVNTNDALAFILLPLLLLCFAVFRDKRILFICFVYSFISFSNLYAILMSANYFKNLPNYLLDSDINRFYTGSILTSGGAPFLIQIMSAISLLLAVFLYIVMTDIIFNQKLSLFKASGRLTLGQSLQDFAKRRVPAIKNNTKE